MAGTRFPLLRAVAPWGLAVLLWLFMYRLTLAADLNTDSRAYWLTGHVEELYRTGPATKDAYLYSPAFAQVISPLTHLSEWTFYLVWIGAEALVLVWLLRPLRLPWALCAAALCVPELIIGNIYLFMAGALVVAMRWPAAWAFLVLTKITPGIGALYFLLTGAWRRFAVAVVATVTVAAVSFVVAPDDWLDWARFLTTHSSGSGTALWFQLPLSLALVVLAARLRRPWLVVVSVFASAPVMTTPAAGAILAALPRLWSAHRAMDGAGQPLLVEGHERQA